MYRMGEEEVRRVRKVIQSGRMFRYYEGAECARFEKDWARHVGVKHARLDHGPVRGPGGFGDRSGLPGDRPFLHLHGHGPGGAGRRRHPGGGRRR